MPLHVSSTVVLIIARSKLYYTASGIITKLHYIGILRDIEGEAGRRERGKGQ